MNGQITARPCLSLVYPDEYRCTKVKAGEGRGICLDLSKADDRIGRYSEQKLCSRCNTCSLQSPIIYHLASGGRMKEATDSSKHPREGSF